MGGKTKPRYSVIVPKEQKVKIKRFGEANLWRIETKNYQPAGVLVSRIPLDQYRDAIISSPIFHLRTINSANIIFMVATTSDSSTKIDAPETLS